MRTSINYLNNLFIPLLPETKLFGFKRFLWKLAGVKIGDNVKICSSVKIIGNGNLSIGNNTWVGPNTLISCHSNIKIGSYCDIAPLVFIGDGTHVLDPISPNIAGAGCTKDVLIGDGCWLCVSSRVIAGVSLGNKNILAAGSILTNSYNDDMSLLAGCPAFFKKRLKD